MPHIHTEKGQHDITASAFIVRTDNGEPRVLLHMHKKLAKLLQPGGHVELHENLWQGALHEIQEETGYLPGQLLVLQPAERLRKLDGVLLHPQPMSLNTHRYKTDEHFHTDAAFVFVANGPPKALPVDGESTDIRWLSLRDLARLSTNELSSGTRQHCEYAINVCLKNWEAVSLNEFAA